jgi:hypothetical protein
MVRVAEAKAQEYAFGWFVFRVMTGNKPGKALQASPCDDGPGRF